MNQAIFLLFLLCGFPYFHLLSSQSISYPFTEFSLETLEDFANITESWVKVKDVWFDPEGMEGMIIEEGTGVLLNTLGEKWKSNLLTNFEHEDIELELDFMMAKGSNAGIFLQGRYEVQMYDSWLESRPGFSDNGGIYQRWNSNAEPGKKGFDGIAPIVNASKAPGLWQHFRIVFQAPRFDIQGNKIRNAVFREVYLNGVLVQNNVEVTGPTRDAKFKDESSLGPIMFQGDHGVFAMKNIRYKLYRSEKVTLSELSVESFDNISSLADFNVRPVQHQAKIDFIDHSVPSEVDDFGGIIKGKMNIPLQGIYDFNLDLAWIPDNGANGPNGGGQFKIGDSILFLMDGNHRMGHGTIELAPGIHDFEIRYYKSFRYGYAWSNGLSLGVEGPQIPYSLLSPPLSSGESLSFNKILLKSKGDVLFQRGFYRDTRQVLTHAFTVGFPGNVSYAYDLNSGKLVSVWHGGYINATGMWDGRGTTQQMVPIGNVMYPAFGMNLEKDPNSNPDLKQEETYKPVFKGYGFSDGDNPMFFYSWDGVPVSDRLEYLGREKGLTRDLTFDLSEEQAKVVLTIISGKKAEKIWDDLFVVGDKEFYLRFKEGLNPVIQRREDGSVDWIFKREPSDNNKLEIGYSIIW